MPTSDMRGMSSVFLKHSFEILMKQTFKDFNVVITDNSTNDDVKKTCEQYKNKLDINYSKNADINCGMSANVNNSIKKATGKLVKILFLDDFLYSPDSLQEIVDAFDLTKDHWLVTACEHSKDGKTFFRPYYPRYNDQIHLGKNTISSPSVLTIKNENPLFFDEKLTWMMDCDYYKRLYNTYGKPKILNKINAVNRVGEHQTTNEMTEKIRKDEYDYVVEKYKNLKIIRHFNMMDTLKAWGRKISNLIK